MDSYKKPQERFLIPSLGFLLPNVLLRPSILRFPSNSFLCEQKMSALHMARKKAWVQKKVMMGMCMKVINKKPRRISRLFY